MDLVEYIRDHTDRGECKCGQCVDVGDKPDPAGHTVDMFFFKMAARNEPTADELRPLIESHRGDFCELDPLDGGEHSYINVGAWIGDQGLALLLIGLGKLVGLWDVMQPNLLPMSDDLKQQMAGAGMVSLTPLREVVRP